MFFTQEDYRKIEKWLLSNSIKDTEFVEASTPLQGNETLAFVQKGKNVKVSLKDLIDQIFLLGVSDFLNISDKYKENYISLNQAIALVPNKSRKIGQVITFLNQEGVWKIYQFQGTKVNQWNNTTLWVDLIQQIQGLDIIDSEDIIPKISTTNQTSLLLADKSYNPNDFSGLGRVYLRKTIVNVEDPVTGNIVKMNYLTQSMISKENTIYIVQYSYNLNKQTISIPEGSILVFEGGDINNGTINCNGTVIVGKFDGNATITGTYSFQDAQADEEDITQSQSSVLKFKDKEYDEANFSGLGRTYLRKNIVNGINILSQDMINNSNTIYHIQYDYNLNGQTITIPEGCVLKFNGGSISNGTISSNYLLLNDYKFTDIVWTKGSVFDFIHPITVPVKNTKVFIETILDHKPITSTKPTTFLFNSSVPYAWEGILNVNKKYVKFTGGGVIQGCINIGLTEEEYTQLGYTAYIPSAHFCISFDNLTFNKYNYIGSDTDTNLINTFINTADVSLNKNISLMIANANHVKVSNCFFDNVPYPIVYTSNSTYVNQNVRRFNITNCDFEKCNIAIYAPSTINSSLERGDLEIQFCNFFAVNAAIVAYNIDGFKCYNNVFNTATNRVTYGLNMRLYKGGQIMITNNSFYGEYNRCAIELENCGIAVIDANSFASQYGKINTVNDVGCVRVLNNEVQYGLSIQNNLFQDVRSLPIYVNCSQNRGCIIDGNVIADNNYDIAKRTIYYINSGFINKLQSNYTKNTLLTANVLDVRLDIIHEYQNSNNVLYPDKAVDGLNSKTYGSYSSKRLFKVGDFKTDKSITVVRCLNVTKYSTVDDLIFLFNGIRLSIPFSSLTNTTVALNVLKSKIDEMFSSDFDTYIISGLLWIKSKTVRKVYTPAAELSGNSVNGCFSVEYQNLGYNIELVDVDRKPFLTTPTYISPIDSRSNNKLVTLFGKSFVCRTTNKETDQYLTLQFRNAPSGYSRVYFLNDTYFGLIDPVDTATVLETIITTIYPDKYSISGLFVTSLIANKEFHYYNVPSYDWIVTIPTHVVNYKFSDPSGISYTPGEIESQQSWNDYGITDRRPTDVKIGFIYFDTTLGKYICWNGTAWINLDGTALA